MITGKWFTVFALLVLCIGLGATQEAAAACGPYPSIYTTGNNFTMLDPAGGSVGGTNDVTFTWDGTLKTSVAVSTQVSNATIGSTCPFNGFTWKAHDVAVYGPGTYTVKASCAAKAPGCATGTNPITFMVGPDEIGVHMLFDWGTVSTNKNIDVVNVWKKSSPFGPSALWTGACGSNSAGTVWDLMSKDPGTGINGYPMVDGGFIGFRANFNMMGPVVTRMIQTSNNNFTMDQPDGVAFGGSNDVCFTWDGTLKTSVAVSGQVSNASVSSPCAFFGQPWWAHDMAIYGPGTYTVYPACPAGSPGCGDASLGTLTFTVKPGEIGGHMLFYWNGNDNIDVVDVWKRGTYDQGVDPALCTPAEFWAGACGAGNAATVWDYMSYDWDGDCVNGAGMVDGPFQGMNANFNLMGCAGCGVCDPPDCNDNNACTIDACIDNMCMHTPVNCDDSNICTADSCNTAAGCVHTATVPTSCNDSNYCTTDGCSNNACTHVPITCDDIPCYTGICLPSQGCLYMPVVCNDNNACTSDSCNPVVGCVYTAINCNDNNACTVDTCNPATGCVHTPIVCINEDPCTITSCGPSGCVYTRTDCNDNNACTIDTCNWDAVGVCIHIPNTITCPLTTGNNFTMIDPTNTAFGGTNDVVFAWDGTKKTKVECPQIANATISSSCSFFGVAWAAHDVAVYGPGTYTVYTDCPAGCPSCGLGAPITFTVKAGEIGMHMLFDWNGNYNIDVVNVMKANAASSALFTGGCGTNSACTVWGWASYDFDGDGISGTPMVDGPFVGMNANFNLNKVSVDLCCNCKDDNACAITSCDPATGVCLHTPIVCNDNNPCTIDTCNTATGCVFTAINCNDNNACTADTCDPVKGCVHTPIICNDNNACTADTCDTATGCRFTPISTDDHNPCTIETCNPATGVIITPKNCNDNNACTADSCNTATGACVNTPIVCNDNNVCTTDTCDTATGCRFTPIITDDHNACTIETCNPATGVIYTPIICDDNNACTTDSCNSATGCVYTPIVCNDNNACTIDSCNPTTGCVFTPIVCNDNNTCTVDSCDPVAGCVYMPLPDGSACPIGCGGICSVGICVANVSCCPTGSVKSVTIRGGGQKPTSVDLQIQTNFTVANDGCIVESTASTVTCTPGTILLVNVKAGIGPMPSSCTWQGASISTDIFAVECPAAAGDIGKLICDNKLNGGKDVDRITITVQ